MERVEAINKLKVIVGQDLRTLADELGITVFKDGKKNKGWAGHTIERYLGLPLNSSHAPNFGSWELKVIPLVYRRDGTLRVKETMAITMLDPLEVQQKSFEQSYLYNKLQKILIVSRIYEDQQENHSILYGLANFDLTEPSVYHQILEDYNLVQQTLRSSGQLSGRMGVLIQPRTKGPGHGSTSRAFYARTHFVSQMLGLGG